MIDKNIAGIRDRIAAAARRSGRDPGQITLMAVTKTLGSEPIREAYAAGLRIFGENRVQEFAGKAGELQDLNSAEWHMIGHLQSNKTGKAVELFSAVDSLDSLRLGERLNTSVGERGGRLPVLIEINIGGESAKTGIRPDSQELWQLLESAPQWPHLAIRGLMTVPPFTEDPQQARPFFRRLRQIRDQIAARQLPGVNMDVLSMGMSHDFEVAIEEGSTCVRVGTAIFGARKGH